jgi:hypothetical protein
VLIEPDFQIPQSFQCYQCYQSFQKVVHPGNHTGVLGGWNRSRQVRNWDVGCYGECYRWEELQSQLVGAGTLSQLGDTSGWASAHQAGKRQRYGNI